MFESSLFFSLNQHQLQTFLSLCFSPPEAIIDVPSLGSVQKLLASGIPEGPSVLTDAVS